MEHVGDAKAVACDDLGGARQNMGQLPGRHRAVHADVVGDAARRPEGGLAALPDQGGLHGGPAFANDLNAMRMGDLDDALQLGVHFYGRSLDFDDQHGGDIERIAGLGEGLADLDGGLVHEFHRHRK